MFWKSKTAVIDEEEAKAAARKEVEAEQQKELEIKQYNNIRSKCLDCKNAFWQQYISNPHKPDPLVCVCKIKWQLDRDGKRASSFYVWECCDDKWYKKILACSDFEQRC